MAIPSSGPISLNQFHVEAGGGSGTQASLNDSDIRGLIGKTSGAQMAFNEWYGASSFTPPALGTYRVSNFLPSPYVVGYPSISAYTFDNVNYYASTSWGPNSGNWTFVNGGYGGNTATIGYIRFSGTPVNYDGNYFHYTGTATGINVTSMTIYSNSGVSPPQGHPNYYNLSRTYFPEIQTTSSRIAITDINNNLIYVANFTGNPISGLPSSIGTGSFSWGYGECTPSWYRFSGSTTPFNLTVGNYYRMHFAVS
jgi:hypothetical protein